MPRLTVAADATTSRFFSPADRRLETVAGVRLPPHWWSRPYEYAWAARFSGAALRVLDAGCGVSHPFKWHLAETCASVDAVDLDGAIQDGMAFVAVNRAEWGDQLEAMRVNWDRARLRQGDITALNSPAATFDRIFCLSVLEHMEAPDRTLALREFARVLAPGGLLVLTADAPPVVPSLLLQDAAICGLVPIGPVSLDTDDLLLGCCAIFRCALRKEAETCGC